MYPEHPSIAECKGNNAQVAHHVRPEGWQNDPDQEIWKLSDLDYTQPPVFLQQTFVYRLPAVDDKEKTKTENILTNALARTARQCRTLSGVLEEEAGEVRICKTRDSYISFIVKHLNQTTEDATSFDDLAFPGFPSCLVTNIAGVGDSSTTHTATNGSLTTRGQPVVEIQASWIPGGLLITVGYHHSAMDGTAFTAWVKQWAKTARALKNGTDMPTWDPATLSRHRLNGTMTPPQARPTPGQEPQTASPYSEAALVPLATPQAMKSIILHFSQAKIAALKAAATTPGGTENERKISSYDAIAALLWQTHTRARLTMYDPVPGEFTILGSAINLRLRNRFSPPIHQDLQANACGGALTQPVPVLEAVASESLPRLASLVRESHAAMTEELAVQRLNWVASLPDKKQAALSVSSMPRFAVAVSDGRARSGGDLYDGSDFGFGKPVAVRNVYQPGMPVALRSLSLSHCGGGDCSDGQVEVEMPVEERCLGHFVSDAELLRYAKVISS
ncbi:Transferase [Rhypophila decipiens]